MSYGGRIRAVPGVERVAHDELVRRPLPAKKEEKADAGGQLDATNDWSNFFPNLAVEAEPFLAMYPEYEIPQDQYRALLQDLRGCVIGRKLAEKFGWKIGDSFFLESFIPAHRKANGPFEFVVRAIYDTDPVSTRAPHQPMLFHLKYLYEATGRRMQAPGPTRVEIEDPERAGEVSQAIDALLREQRRPDPHRDREGLRRPGSSPWPETSSLLLNGIGIAVTFTILLVAANTMSMAVRERRKEIAVLKTLGFTSARVMGAGGGRGAASRRPRGRDRDRREPRDHVGLQPHARDPGRPRGDGPVPADAAAAGRRARVRAWRSSSGSPPVSFPPSGAYRARITEMLRTV